MKYPILMVSALCFAGCVVGDDYRRPETSSPEEWSEAAGEHVAAETADLARWWTSFGDPMLDSLVERADAANLDLKIAALRVREARAQAGQVRADRLPQVDAVGGVERSRSSENVDAPGAGGESDLYRAGFDARWELDIFGGTARSIEAADADIEATIADRRAVQVSLFGEVARAYVDLRGSQRLASIARRNIESARATVEVTRARLDGGMDTSLDAARAEALLATTRASLPPLEAATRIAIHRLGILLGEHPSSLAAELEAEGPIPAPPERILVGVPSDVLLRRPDVRAAERRLAAATARTGAAEADRYPRFSLTGAFGLESANSGDFADAASRAWSIGPAMRWPIFAGGRILANIQVQDARAQQAGHAYEQTVLAALEEVENALVSYLREWDHRRALEAAVIANRSSVDLADELFRRGLTTFLDVLDAERNAYDAELELARSEAATSLQVVALYKALGGGWDPDEVEEDDRHDAVSCAPAPERAAGS